MKLSSPNRFTDVGLNTERTELMARSDFHTNPKSPDDLDNRQGLASNQVGNTAPPE
jgi:hypothetical protein